MQEKRKKIAGTPEGKRKNGPAGSGREKGEGSVRVTLEDVAEKAGVSAATVSVCLNNHPVARKIPEATKKRIAKVVAELGYRPSAFARALCTGRSNLIGIDVREISNSYFAYLAGYVIDEAAKYDFNVIVTQDRNRSGRGSTLPGDMLDGMLCCSTPPRRTPGAKPCVLIDSEKKGFNCILHDIGSAMEESAKLLKARGHKHVYGVFDLARDKAAGFVREFRKAGLVPELSPFPTSSREDRLSTVVRILREKPAALVINGHLTTRDMLRELAASGGTYHPDILSVCGFWNGELEDDPHLLGVTVTDVRKLASGAVEMLAESIRKPDSPTRTERIPARFYRKSEFSSIPSTDPENEY